MDAEKAGRGPGTVQTTLLKELFMGKPNFNFQKRQKELAKKKKSEEKRQRKLERNAEKPAEDAGAPADSGVVQQENAG